MAIIEKYYLIDWKEVNKPVASALHQRDSLNSPKIMLNIFKKNSKKNLTLAINLVSRMCQLLPDKFMSLRDQIHDGIIKDVKLLEKPFPYYHKFIHDVNILNRYEDKKGRSFIIKGILVNDRTINSFTAVNLVVAYGILIGYSTPQVATINPDLESIRATSLTIEFFGENAFNKIKSIISPEDLKWINPSDVYEIELNECNYYHIKDLQDGDLIAIDLSGNVFKLTHDPFEIKKLNESLSDILSSVFNV